MTRLLVFPNDPISALVEKGSIRERYFNPGTVFDEIHVISPGSSDKVDATIASQLVGNAKLVIHSCNYTSRIFLLPIFRSCLYRRLRNIIKAIEPDVIRAYNPMLGGWLAVQAGTDLGVPTVISVHTDYWRDQTLADSLYKGRLLRALYYFYQDRFVAPYVLRTADVVVCKYKYVREWAVQRGARAPIIVYNQIDTNLFTCPDRSFERLEEPRIVTTGRLEPIKNVELLLRALALCRGTLTVIGDGSQRQYLENLAKRLGISARVQFKGFIPNSELKNYYCKHDIFISTTYGGGVGVAMLEAMASGLPMILTTNRWDKDRDVAQAGALLVEPTPSSVAAAIKELSVNPELRKALSIAGAAAVRNLNGETGEAEIYLRILQGKGIR